LIGAIFSLVFLAALIVNGYQQYVKGADKYLLITELKHKLLESPDDEAL
jgi:hypothetical protein